jgi:DNA-binding PadR family transcriptional regulator
MKKPWFHILLSLASGDRYGSAIQEDVGRLSDGAVRLWPATLYGALEELREAGLIREVRPDEVPAEPAGRERYYRITEPGRDLLRGEAQRLGALARVAHARLEGGA